MGKGKGSHAPASPPPASTQHPTLRLPPSRPEAPRPFRGLPRTRLRGTEDGPNLCPAALRARHGLLG